MSKKRRTKKGGKRIPSPATDLKQAIRNVFETNPEEAFSYRQVLKILGIRDLKSKHHVKDLLFSLEKQGQIRKNRAGRWVSTFSPQEYRGLVDHVNPRFAYIEVEDLEEDIWVRTDDLNYAVDGDLVSVVITRHATDSHRAEGRVLNIIKRNKDEFVGRIEVSTKYSFVVPDNRNLHCDIFIYPEKAKKAQHNDKVIVQVKKWHDRQNRSPLGEIKQVLGPAGEHEAEMHSIMAEFELPFEFSAKVEQEADKISEKMSPDEIAKRKDFRKVTTMTIDPEDAKDFDDAISIEHLEKDRYRIGIHIADVSHYVRPDTLLEKEALERATSVYLVDRTIPMLPEKLSNGLCSLRPREDKFTFSSVFDMDTSGRVHKRWFGKTIIHSDRRFTYEEAQTRIESKEGDFASELTTLNSMAHQLRDNRFKDGAINFETVEVKFELDEKGKPIKVIPKERKDAHKMVEEFMLLANREVATYIYQRKEGKKPEGTSTFVYRTHDDPDLEKLENFSSFASRFGYKLDLKSNLSKNLNSLMSEINGKPEQNILESIAIRTMAKAKYTTDPKGHFGLAFEHYTHFTSPIRRYPDVMVHRLLENYLNGEKSPDREPYEKKCIHSSEREKRATDAERASIKYKQVEFMSESLGDIFEGIVSGVTEWGIFVEIVETKCEGMIRMADMDDDYYDFDEKNFRVVGRKSKRIISLGDQLHVQVVKTDIDRRTIDLFLVNDPENVNGD